MKRKILKSMISLLHVGFVVPVIRKIESLLSTIDNSLVRFVTMQLLSEIRPPYSVEFLKFVLKLIEKFKSNANSVEQPDLIAGILGLYFISFYFFICFILFFIFYFI